MDTNKRKFIVLAGGVAMALPLLMLQLTAIGKSKGKSKGLQETSSEKNENKTMEKKQKVQLGDAEWKEKLTAQQYYVLRQAGTEKPGSSPLNDEKREGQYHCVGCDALLYTSEMKYDSGTGWPSFFTTVPGAFETSTDYKLIYPRTEYHCATCDGHHGHVFQDGPKPTGQRWCNNGIALRFEEKSLKTAEEGNKKS